VALFLEEQTGKLLRLPPEGRENSAEPLFFALPPKAEADAAKISGYWYVQGVRGDGSKAYLRWELTAWEGRLRGRFDPNSDYRVADLVGGSFRSNRIELEVKYINDRYSITGQWTAGRLAGSFRNFDGSEEGSWEAHQSRVSLPAGRTAELYEWRRNGVDVPRYRPRDAGPGPDWHRGRQPLCRVWVE
jgi:hypothetical protein